MTPFQKLVRRVVERWRRTYYEGPEPPARLGEMVVDFANHNPHATRQEWIEFGRFHAAECYRSGFTRGAEWAERDFGSRMPDVSPERIADAQDPDWEWSPNILLVGSTGDVVLEVNDEEKLAREHREQYERMLLERNRR